MFDVAWKIADLLEGMTDSQVERAVVMALVGIKKGDLLVPQSAMGLRVIKAAPPVALRRDPKPVSKEAPWVDGRPTGIAADCPTPQQAISDVNAAMVKSS